MTDERKNEIWAMLPSSLKTEIAIRYASLSDESKRPITNETPKIFGRILMLEELFGKHNLTAQAEEKPKEPRFKVGDKVKLPFLGGEVATITEVKIVNRLPKYIAAGQEWCGCHLDPYPSENGENGISYSKIQSESAESVETSANSQSVNHIPDTAKKVDYSQYRLDLAKEIAVAVIRSDRWDFNSCDPVKEANEIVKRLKETDESTEQSENSPIVYLDRMIEITDKIIAKLKETEDV